jgi:hypothetical protein
MWNVVVALVALWAVGLATGIGHLGNLVYLFLLLAVVVTAINLVRSGPPRADRELEEDLQEFGVE